MSPSRSADIREQTAILVEPQYRLVTIHKALCLAESDLQRAIREALASGDLNSALEPYADEAVRTAEEARAIAELAASASDRLLEVGEKGRLPVHAVTGLFQQVDTEEAFLILRDRGLPGLRRIFQTLLDRPASADGDEALLFLAKILALYRCEEDLELIAAAARTPKLQDHPLWSIVFQSFEEGHPLREGMLDALRDPLPEGFAGVAYLDFANALAREGSIAHPFDTTDGPVQLERHLTDPDSRRFTHAHSAAAALPFLSGPARGQLMALAFDHPSERVQLQAGWASAKLGSRAGIDFLSRFCLDQRYSAFAVEYLRELGELNAIPARAMNPDFAAVAEMCRWLAHPMEYGRPPDEAEVYDTRTLFWPPAQEPRRLHLVKYRYRGANPDGSDGSGIGLVGSITFALFGETNADMLPEDVYALHCCWELEAENDPRAPAQRSVEAGRELLRKARNAGF